MELKTALRQPKQKRSRERVALILKATQEVLKSDGIKALTTNSIAAHANIPVSSIYQYFPNKEAIILGLYEDYLERIRDMFEEVDTPENRSLPWREYFTLLLTRLEAAETDDNLEVELEVALGFYPQLLEADRRHEEWIACRLVETMKQMGARWGPAKLKRFAYFMYEGNSAVWSYRARHSPPTNETLEWHLASFFAIAAGCFE